MLQMVKACFVGQIEAINGHHGSSKEHFTEIRKLILARRIPERELIQKISLQTNSIFGIQLLLCLSCYILYIKRTARELPKNYKF